MDASPMFVTTYIGNDPDLFAVISSEKVEQIFLTGNKVILVGPYQNTDDSPVRDLRVEDIAENIDEDSNAEHRFTIFDHSSALKNTLLEIITFSLYNSDYGLLDSDYKIQDMVVKNGTLAYIVHEPGSDTAQIHAIKDFDKGPEYLDKDVQRTDSFIAEFQHVEGGTLDVAADGSILFNGRYIIKTIRDAWYISDSKKTSEIEEPCVLLAHREWKEYKDGFYRVHDAEVAHPRWFYNGNAFMYEQGGKLYMKSRFGSETYNIRLENHKVTKILDVVQLNEHQYPVRALPKIPSRSGD